MTMYEDLIKKLRNRRVCIQSGGDLEADFPIMKEAADAIEELNRLRVAAEENRMHWQDMAVKFECDLHDAEGKIPKWISVTERLPEENGEFLVCGRWREKPIKMWVCERVKLGLIMGWVNPAENPVISHWMPLPEPPKEETE